MPPKVFVELVRDGGNVVMYARVQRRRSSTIVDSAAATAEAIAAARSTVAFYLLLRRCDQLTEAKGSVFHRATETVSQLQLFAARSKGFGYTGRGHTGIVSVERSGVATVPLRNIVPNAAYRIAICFGDDPAQGHPFVDTIQLRELDEASTAALPIIQHCAPHSPWTLPLFPSWTVVNIVAAAFHQWMGKTTHDRRPPLHNRVTIRNLHGGFCEMFVTAVQQAGRMVQRLTPGAGPNAFNATPSQVFSAFCTIAAQTEASAHKGPWTVDWFDFALLTLLPPQALPRLEQLAQQLRSLAQEEHSLRDKVRWMALPEMRPLPPGSLFELFAEPPPMRRSGHSPLRVLHQRRAENGGPSTLPDAMPEYRVLQQRSSVWTPSRAVWALCSTKQQLYVLRYYVTSCCEAPPPGSLHRRSLFDRIMYDVRAKEREEFLAKPPKALANPMGVAIAFSRRQRIASLQGPAADLADRSAETHRRLTLEQWAQCTAKLVRRREDAAAMRALLRTTAAEAIAMFQHRQEQHHHECYKRWHRFVLERRVGRLLRRTRLVLLRARWHTLYSFSRPTEFQIRRPIVSVAAPLPASVSVAPDPADPTRRRVTYAVGPLQGEALLPVPRSALAAPLHGASLGRLASPARRPNTTGAPPTAPADLGSSAPLSSAGSAAMVLRRSKKERRPVTLLETGHASAVMAQLPQLFPAAAQVMLDQHRRRTLVDRGRADRAETAEVRALREARRKQMAEMVYVLWRVNHMRWRDHAFRRWRAWATSMALMWRQREFVEHTLVTCARRARRRLLREYTRRWARYAKVSPDVVAGVASDSDVDV